MAINPSEKAFGADDQQERIANNSPASVEAQFGALHKRAEELLGDAYDAEKVDEALQLQSNPEGVIRELEEAVSTTDPVLKRRNIGAWYKKHHMFEEE